MKKLSEHQLSFLHAIKYYGLNYPANVGGILHLNNINDYKKVKEALTKVLNKIDILNYKIKEADNYFYQYFDKKEIIIDEFDFTNKWDELFIKNYFQKPIDYNDNLYRIALIKGKSQISILLVMHHLISDSITVSLITSMVLDELDSTESIEVESYNKYLIREENYLNSKRFNLDHKYWSNAFINTKETYAKPFWTSKELDEVIIEEEMLDENLTKNIDDFIKRYGGSPQVLFELLIAAELKHVNSSNNITLGITSYNRRKDELHIPGMLVSTLPLSLEIKEDDKIIDFYNNIILNHFKTYRYQMYPYRHILKEAYENNINYIFDTMVIYHVPFLKDTKINYHLQTLNNKNSVLSLSLNVFKLPPLNNYTLSFEFKKSVFPTKEERHSYIKRLLNRLNIVLDDPKQSFNSLITEPALIKKEYQVKETDILKLINKQITDNLNRIALIENNKEITYQELLHKSNRVAAKLQHLNINNKVIKIDLDSKIDSIIALLGVIMSNNTYVFFPNNLNENLVDTYSKIANVKEIVDKKFLKDINEFNYIDNIRTNEILAIYFTSGTTGLPKAVKIKDIGIINYVFQNKAFQKDLIKLERLVNFSNFNFDISLENIFLSLLNGKTLILADLNNLDDNNLLNNDFISTTPSIMQFILKHNPNILTKTKVVVLGGETLGLPLVNQINNKSKATIYNSYGPTEASIAVTYKKIEDEITIGIPYEGCFIDVVNKDLVKVPNGYVGELLISGICLTDGYTVKVDNDPFIEINNTKYYRTGDYGYINYNNELVLTGRIDNQIKKNGIRIDLEQIDKILLNYHNVIQSKTIFENNTIYTYVVTNNETEISIYNYLKGLLPAFYLPKHIIIQDKLLINEQGKMIVSSKEFIKDEPYIPKNEFEQLFIESLKKVFKITEVYKNDTIYDLGADSLDIFSLMIELNNVGINFPIQKFSETPKVVDLLNSLNTVKETSKENKYHNLVNIKDIKELNNILLLGSTGFLGSHILQNLLKNTNAKISVIIRDHKNIDGLTYFKEIMTYYFNNKIDYSRINFYLSDITKTNFGLDNTTYNKLKKEVDLVVNCAAKVDYIGNYDEFYNINVNLINHIIDFTKDKLIPIVHISTIGLALAEKKIVKESYLLNQEDYLNYYLKTKRNAEDILIKYKKETNNPVYILRVGNLMPTTTNLKFQINYENNAIYQIFKNITEYTNLNKQYELDISPVNYIVELVTKVIINRPELVIYHLYTPTVIKVNNDLNYELTDSYRLISQKESIESLGVFKGVSKRYIKRVIRSWTKILNK